jgi:hypothetical protein
MVRSGFPRLSHPGLAHAIPSIAFIAHVYRGAKLVVSRTISEVKVIDQQRPAQAPTSSRRPWNNIMLQRLTLVPLRPVDNS